MRTQRSATQNAGVDCTRELVGKITLLILFFNIISPFTFAQDKLIHYAFVKLPAHFSEAWRKGEEDAKKKRKPEEIINRFRRGIGDIRTGIFSTETVSFAWYFPPETSVYYYSYEAKRLYKSEDEIRLLRDAFLNNDLYIVDTIYFAGVITLMPSFGLYGAVVRQADPDDLKNVRVVLKVGDRIYQPRKQPENILQYQGQESYSILIPQVQSTNTYRSGTFSFMDYSGYGSFGFGSYGQTETATSFYVERVEGGYKWYQGYFQVAFDLFDKSGNPIITADDKEITLIVIYGNNERQAKYKLDDLFNPLRSNKIGNKEKEQAIEYSVFVSKFMKLAREKDYQRCLELCESFMKKFPNSFTTLLYYELLLFVNEQRAYELGRQLARNEHKDNPYILNRLAWSIVQDHPERTLKSPDYALAIEIAQRAVQLTNEENPFILDTLAYALFKLGRVEEAVRYQEKAVALLKEQKDIPEEMRRELEERLKKFRDSLP